MGKSVITIRALRAADVTAVAHLEGLHQPRPWSEGMFRDELRAERRIYLVAEEDEIIGFGGVMLVDEEAHVTNLLVDNARRGQGVGKRLMIELIRAAVHAGARHLTLEVRSKNEPARRLYSSLGLAPVGIRPRYYGEDDALILWAHDIDGLEYLEKLQ